MPTLPPAALPLAGLRLLAAALVLAPGARAQAPAPSASPPAWAEGAVWYQVFPERFRNGDPSNDPTAASLDGAWPFVGTAALEAAGWQPTPWTHDWTRQEPWAARLAPGRFYETVFLRRYGGDLEGVRQALPYLRALGVTALYLNPVNDAPSLHKYDARDYRHVDPDFGPDPAGDRALIARESLTDPGTWTFTSADRLFLEVVREARALGLRTVVDYSWNHTGHTHPAFVSVRQQGAASPFADWYRVARFDDPATPDTSEFAYSGWAGVPELPEWRKKDLTGHPHDGVPYDGNLAPGVREHVFAVSRRWLDPDGDGDPADGVDGFRLDVAEMVPLGFWRDYRAVVKSVNPEALLVGEIWWQRWPDLLMDPRPYLGVFDAVMNYRPLPVLRQLTVVGGPLVRPSAFAAHVDSVSAGMSAAQTAANWTMAASHDSARLLSTLANPRARYKADEGLRGNPAYWGGRPGPEAHAALELFRLVQFTLPGAPIVYYGDEAGMWGADDPDNRRPMVWAHLAHDPETGDALGRAVPPAEVAPDVRLLALHRDLGALRAAHAQTLRRGALRWLRLDDAAGVVVFVREAPGAAPVVTALNVGDAPAEVEVPAGHAVAVVAGDAPEALAPGRVRLPARSGAVFARP